MSTTSLTASHIRNGADIRAARLDLGLSQAQAAALWGINLRTLQDIEQGRSEPRTTLSLLETIIRYHRAFGPPPEETTMTNPRVIEKPTAEQAAAHMADIMRRHGPWQAQLERGKQRGSTTRFYVHRERVSGQLRIVLPDYQPPSYPEPGWSMVMQPTHVSDGCIIYGDWRWCLGFTMDGTPVAIDHLPQDAYDSVPHGPEVEAAREKLRSIGFPNPRRAA